MPADQNTSPYVFMSTGVPGLIDILASGLIRDRLYRREGSPGAGKTRRGLQFLAECARQGEQVLYISLAENAVELRAVAESDG